MKWNNVITHTERRNEIAKEVQVPDTTYSKKNELKNKFMIDGSIFRLLTVN